MPMKKQIILLWLSCLCYGSSAQVYIDSITISPAYPTTTDNISVIISGTYPNTGVINTRIETSIIADVVAVEFYVTDCGGFSVLVPFDTAIDIGTVLQGNYTVIYYGIIDTNTVDTVNCVFHPVTVVFDSIFLPL